MKNGVLNFLKKYRLLVWLNMLVLIGTVCFGVFGRHIFVSKSEFISLSLYSVYALIGLPIYSFIYGCMSYLIYKKVWFQQMLLAITLALAFVFENFISGRLGEIVPTVIIFTPCFVVISLFGSAIGFIVRTMKENDV